MSKYVLISALLLIIPISVLAGNTAVIRASFTIPQRVEINEEFVMPAEEEVSEEGEYEIVVEEERMIAIGEATRQNQRVILKTVLVK